MSRRFVDRHPSLTVTLLLTAVMVGLFVFHVVPRSATFRINADTEFAELAIAGERGQLSSLTWYVDAARIGDVMLDSTFEYSGAVSPRSGATLRASLITDSVALQLSITGTDTDAGRMVSRQDVAIEPPTGNFWVRMPLDTNRALVIPYFGAVTIGRHLQALTNLNADLLLGGRVEMLGESPWMAERYRVGEFDLIPGDRVSVSGDGDCSGGDDAVGTGVLRVTPGGIQVVHEVVGQALRIDRWRAGSEGAVCVRPSLYRYWLADPIVGSLLLVASIAFIALVEAIVAAGLAGGKPEQIS